MNGWRLWPGVGVVILVTILTAGLGFAQEPGSQPGAAPVALVSTAPSAELGTGFTYQGRLEDGSDHPVTGMCDLDFTLWDAETGGSPIGHQIVAGVNVEDGYLAVLLNSGGELGVDVFEGEARWLKIGVKCSGDADWSVLPGRQLLSAVPYALHARSAGALRGYPVAAALPALDQVLKWDGSAWAPAADEMGTAGDDWSLTGNSATVPGTHFLGTTDEVSLTLAVSGTAALRLEPNGTSPNLIGGHSHNQAAATVVGATVGGGGSTDSPNQVTAGFGTVGGGSGNQASGNRATVGGGWDNTADGIAATVSGGRDNVADGMFTAVGGGWNNLADKPRATVSGGTGNTASGEGSTVGGGAANVVTATFATIAGGEQISVTGDYAAVGGGSWITATGDYAAVGGGQYNLASGDYATVGGGYGNTASYRATVGGGYHNTASNDYATVGGGTSNRASGSTATVGGGTSNRASGGNATIGGGWGNTTSDYYATVGGGYNNTASYQGTVVGGGYVNTASDDYATVGGGTYNTASYAYATVGGGYANQASDDYATVGGGHNNTAAGSSATIPGGYHNIAEGDYSFAAGRNAWADDTGAFVWADSTSAFIYSPGVDTFTVRASGGIWFGTDSSPSIPGDHFINTSTGGYLSTGGAWTDASDRERKENFAPVDGGEVLARLADVPITTWNYRAQDESVRHMGPTAQDFHAAFGLGEDERHIAALDANGVALAASQELYAQHQAQQAQIEALQQQNADLETRLAALEAAAAHRAGSAQGGILNLGRGGWASGLGVLVLGLGLAWGIRRVPRKVPAGG
jgi:hypothetical protein